MPLFNERQQSFHAKNCCCCGLYVRRQRGAPQTISLAGQSFWGWPPRGYDEGELLLPCIAALPENSHEFEKSWLLFVCVPIFLQLHWQKVNSFKWDLSAANLLLDYKDRYARPFVRHIDIALLAMMQLPEKPGNSSTSSWMLRYFHAVDRSPPQTQTIDA